MDEYNTNSSFSNRTNMMMKTLTSSRINDIHKKMVFRYIWGKERVSRTQIREYFGFSKSTVSGIIHDLIDQELIVESGQENSPLGRKPELLAVNSSGPIIVSVLLKDLGDVEVALIDLGSTILIRESFRLFKKDPPQYAIDEMGVFIQNIIARFPRQLCLGIGLGVPGIVDHQHGVIEYSAHFGWKAVPIGPMLKANFFPELPIVIDNRTTAATLGEMWFGKGKKIQNLICINVGEALGAGIVIEGKIYRGMMDGVGEIGHIQLIDNGTPCFCGKMGCIESMVSLPALMKKIGKNYTSEGAAVQVLREEMTNQSVRNLLGDAFSVLGEITAILTNILAPEKIILIGALTRIDPQRLLQTIRLKIMEKALEPLARKIDLDLSSIHQEKEVLWGASLVMENLFGIQNIH